MFNEINPSCCCSCKFILLDPKQQKSLLQFCQENVACSIIAILCLDRQQNYCDPFSPCAFSLYWMHDFNTLPSGSLTELNPGRRKSFCIWSSRENAEILGDKPADDGKLLFVTGSGGSPASLFSFGRSWKYERMEGTGNTTFHHPDFISELFRSFFLSVFNLTSKLLLCTKHQDMRTST